MSFSLRSNGFLYLVFGLLAFLMAATRFHHFGTELHLPDASLVVFFLGGFYLKRASFFLILLAEATMIDYLAITQLGVSSFCVSPAYGFLLPAYALMWMGGRSLRPLLMVPLGFRFYGYALMSWLLVSTLAFLVSDGSFYLLSGRFADMNLSEYVDRVRQYYLAYISSPLIYLLMAAALHFIVNALRKGKSGQVEH